MVRFIGVSDVVVLIPRLSDPWLVRSASTTSSNGIFSGGAVGTKQVVQVATLFFAHKHTYRLRGLDTL